MAVAGSKTGFQSVTMHSLHAGWRELDNSSHNDKGRTNEETAGVHGLFGFWGMRFSLSSLR